MRLIINLGNLLLLFVFFFLSCNTSGSLSKCDAHIRILESTKNDVETWLKDVKSNDGFIFVSDSCYYYSLIVKCQRDSMPLVDRDIEVEYLAFKLIRNEEFNEFIDSFVVNYWFLDTSERLNVSRVGEKLTKLNQLRSDSTVLQLYEYAFKKVDPKSKATIHSAIDALNKKFDWFDYDEGIKIVIDYYLSENEESKKLEKEINKLLWLLEGVSKKESAFHLKRLKEIADSKKKQGKRRSHQ